MCSLVWRNKPKIKKILTVSLIHIDDMVLSLNKSDTVYKLFVLHTWHYFRCEYHIDRLTSFSSILSPWKRPIDEFLGDIFGLAEPVCLLRGWRAKLVQSGCHQRHSQSSQQVKEVNEQPWHLFTHTVSSNFSSWQLLPPRQQRPPLEGFSVQYYIIALKW